MHKHAANDQQQLVHVLQTRFNMPTPGREAEIRNQPGWLQKRFDLFEAWCLPSVGAQTVAAGRDFVWIIYFDEDTPAPYRERIEALRQQVPFLPFYTGMFPASGWPRSLRKALTYLPPFVLTSRLDNDDALAFDYMERTAQAARHALTHGPTPDGRNIRRTGIVITNGFIRSDRHAYSISHPANAFASWLERSDSDETLKTALGIGHMAAADEGPLVQVSGPGGWLQIVHGGNVSNKVRGRRIRPDSLADRFLPQARAGLHPSSALAVAAENATLMPLRGMRDQLSSIAQKLRRRLR